MRRVSRFGLLGAFGLVLLICSASVARADTLTTLYSFCDNFRCKVGEGPMGRLLLVGQQFFGTTRALVVADRGTVFRIGVKGSFKSLYRFCSLKTCTVGDTVGKYLAPGLDGNVYGVTQRGGPSNDAGTIFKITEAGELTVVYSFCSQVHCLDGSSPVAVTFDPTGNMYGTTIAGGAYREGTLFEITKKGVFKVLHNFCSRPVCLDGTNPGALIVAKDGNLYGTTEGGGVSAAGTAFVAKKTGYFKTLHSFCRIQNCPDGELPTPMLVEGQGQYIYGTTSAGGTTGAGTIFRLTSGGNLKTLYTFCSKPKCADGTNIQDGMILAKDGSFYGVAAAGGAHQHGVLFNVTRDGTYSIVHSFCELSGCSDGSSPTAAPAFSIDGTFFGTTNNGGTNNTGTLYHLTP